MDVSGLLTKDLVDEVTTVFGLVMQVACLDIVVEGGGAIFARRKHDSNP